MEPRFPATDRLGESERNRPETPADFQPDEMEKTVTGKAQVIDWLQRSLAAAKTSHARSTPAELQRPAKIFGRTATLDGIYLRMLVHANEHMGQLIVYARSNGIVPPWSLPSH